MTARTRWRRAGLVVRIALACVFVALLWVGARAHALPLMHARAPNPAHQFGPGSYSRVGDVMVQIEGGRSGQYGVARFKGFPWGIGWGEWSWSPPESNMYVIFRDGSRVRRGWVVTWPSHLPKCAVVLLAQTGPGAAKTFAVHGAWLWGAGLFGLVAVGYGPVVGQARRWRRGPHACAGCGYDLRGLPKGSACPECGGETRSDRA